MSTAALAEGQVVRARVRGIAAGGAGVADLPDGRVVFTPRTAPGDVVDLRIERLHARWAQGTLVAVVEPGEGRVDPPCPRYDACGGCALQHLAYDEQLRWKGRVVADALTRVGKILVDPPHVAPSPERTHYRNRATFTVRRLGGGRIVGGFHALGRPGRVVDVGTECLLPEPAVLEAWGALREAWRSGARPLPAARELRVTVRALDEGVVLLVRGGPGGWDGAELLSRIPGAVGVWHQPGGTAGAHLVAGRATLEAWGTDQVPIGGEAFLQVNRKAAEPLVAHVLALATAALRSGDGGRAVDAYCGIGVYGRQLARDGWTAVGIEADAEACAAARHDAPEGFTVLQGRVEEHLGSLLPAGLVIVNPPRAGLQDRIPGVLLHHRPPCVLYVSCDPATLARDAGRLGDAYRLASLRAFDLFPQTAHVETVALFEADKAA